MGVRETPVGCFPFLPLNQLKRGSVPFKTHVLNQFGRKCCLKLNATNLGLEDLPDLPISLCPFGVTLCAWRHVMLAASAKSIV